jgi:hypothetical protein
MTVVALVPDLMDRSRLGGVVDAFVRDVGALADVSADAAVIDLGAAGALDAIGPLVARGVRVIGFGSHVDTARLDAARAAGAVVLPRSRFFSDPAAAVAQPG